MWQHCTNMKTEKMTSLQLRTSGHIFGLSASANATIWLPTTYWKSLEQTTSTITNTLCLLNSKSATGGECFETLHRAKHSAFLLMICCSLTKYGMFCLQHVLSHFHPKYIDLTCSGIASYHFLRMLDMRSSVHKDISLFWRRNLAHMKVLGRPSGVRKPSWCRIC